MPFADSEPPEPAEGVVDTSSDSLISSSNASSQLPSLATTIPISTRQQSNMHDSQALAQLPNTAATRHVLIKKKKSININGVVIAATINRSSYYRKTGYMGNVERLDASMEYRNPILSTYQPDRVVEAPTLNILDPKRAAVYKFAFSDVALSAASIWSLISGQL
ncbi:hypothetical protein GN244_ATG05884 [Phytophthora infestans]|uniref:Uncharacterized protein n=1 Tax=Phytophthora infestans TaxID=4787 RepID=A0A833SYA1_PHYIN|nr:hypothetical protein GN244_ATG05884 [Phytophthora infestans]KAF4130495.1 hypothetical protein GN958_ATG20297 [Phytophthora infestans]